MKQLTKEQHEAISQWLKKVSSDDFNLAYEFNKEFEPACCDSCADGKACESEPEFKLINQWAEETAKTVNDRLIFGVSYLEIKDRSVKRIDPTQIRFSQEWTKSNPTVRYPVFTETYLETKEKVDRIIKPEASVDRHPEETTGELMRGVEIDEDQAVIDEREYQERLKFWEMLGKMGGGHEISIDRIPEETAGEYMGRVATINGRK